MTLRIPKAALITLGVVVLIGCGGGSAGGDAPTAREVVRHLESEGLPVGEVKVFDEETDPNDLLGRPNGYVAKASWRNPRIEERADPGGFDVSTGGSVEVFDSEDGAARRVEYVQTLAEEAPLFGEYTFQDGSVVLRVSDRLTPDEADEYEAALGEL
jgi:hypothetical protein